MTVRRFTIKLSEHELKTLIDALGVVESEFSFTRNAERYPNDVENWKVHDRLAKRLDRKLKEYP